MPKAREGMRTMQLSIPESDMRDLELLCIITQTTPPKLIKSEVLKILNRNSELLDRTKAAAMMK